jgi:type II secretory pathway component PulF
MTLFALPMIGTLRRDQTAGQFARTMSVLLMGGAPEPLVDEVEELLTGVRGRHEVDRVLTTVASGASPYTPHRRFPIFRRSSRSSGLGEETGKLEEFLRKAAELFEQRTERLTSRLVALAERR